MPPWSRPNSEGGTASAGVRFTDIYQDVLVVLSILFAILFARRNWKLGRVDRKGAARVAAARFLVALLAWFGAVHLVPTGGLFNLVSLGVSDWLFSAAIIYLLYFALEPSLRARWPHSLVTWNRIIAGRWLDPQVGAHILIGAAVGCILLEMLAIPSFWLGPRDTLQAPGSVLFIEGVREWIGGHAARMGQAITVGMSFFFALSFIRTLARRDWIAAIVASVLGVWIEGGIFRSANWQITVAVLLVIYFAIFMVMLRFGLVATVTALFFVNSFNAIVLGYDWTAWYAPYGIATLAMLLTIAIVAFVRSLGSRSLFGGDAAAEGV
jgi:serine/threonine-protein kinase